MKLVIRFDVSKEIGFGHLARMSTLAESFLRHGAGECQLFMAVNSDPIAKKYLSDGPWQVIERGWESDEAFVETILRKVSPDVILFDQRRDYPVESVQKWGRQCKIIIIDFLGRMTPYVDLTIIPNDHNDLSNVSGKIVSGLDFTLINRDVLEMGPKKNQAKSINRIVVTAGGTDPHRVMNRVHHCAKETPSYLFAFLIGENFKHKEFFDSSLESKNILFKQFRPVELVRGDLVVSAFGITPYECLYLNVPVLVVTYSEDQVKPMMKLSKQYGLIRYWGHVDQLTPGNFVHAIKQINLTASFDYLSYRHKVQKASQNIINQVQELLAK